MLPFDIRHPLRDAMFNLHEIWQPVEDFQASDLAFIHTTDVFEKLRHRLFQLEVTGTGGRLAIGYAELQNPYHGQRGRQYQRATANPDGFEMPEANLPQEGDEVTLGRR